MSKATTCKKCGREFINARCLNLHMSIDHVKIGDPIKLPKVRKPKKPKIIGNEWVQWREGNWVITKKYEKALLAEGEDCAWDGLGNYLDESNFESCATDMAHDDFRMTDAGVPRYCTLRECVADLFYEGMLKGKKRVIAEGREFKGRPPHTANECPHHNRPASPPSSTEGRCPYCSGSGSIAIGASTNCGNVTKAEEWKCPKCGGTGRNIYDLNKIPRDCPNCGGNVKKAVRIKKGK